MAHRNTITFGWFRPILAIAVVASVANLNLHTLAVSKGYLGSGDVTFTIFPTVDVFSTTGAAALTAGVFSPTTRVTLINNGFVSGMGGNGSNATDNSGGGLGQAGGAAIDASGAALYTFKINNAFGTIRGGGGGGGGGVFLRNACCPGLISVGGGGGGGGQGHNGGAAGLQVGSTGGSADGSAGSPSSPGAGGAGGFIPPSCCSPGQSGFPGGDGGPWGTAGGNGAGSNLGGSPGSAVTGSVHVTWINTGVILGPLT